MSDNFVSHSDFTDFRYQINIKIDDLERKINVSDKELKSFKDFIMKKFNMFVLIFSILFTFMLTLQILSIFYQNIGNSHVIEKLDRLEMQITPIDFYEKVKKSN